MTGSSVLPAAEIDDKPGIEIIIGGRPDPVEPPHVELDERRQGRPVPDHEETVREIRQKLEREILEEFKEIIANEKETWQW